MGTGAEVADEEQEQAIGSSLLPRSIASKLKRDPSWPLKQSAREHS
jgi:hypothetical protein